ncbi:MAG: quinolinate synthase NadA [Ruminococcus sp.]|jgi:quinolinate synthase|nr:quinolinate synthase NadA [Ruminococcus sp.]
MQNVWELQQKILNLKSEKDIAILAHSYQAEEIQEIADVVGDSFKLSQEAAKLPQKTVIMAGVKFMAETCKILSPEKTVILAHPQAGCPMAEQFEADEIEYLKSQHPNAVTVCYINTTIEIKAVCDVCVTSSSAVSVCKKLPEKEIIFIPDCNLGAFVAKSLPEKHLIMLQGGCPIHACVSVQDTLTSKEMFPGAKLAVHPECQPEICDLADYVGSTSGIINYCKASNDKEFIIGTEISIAEHLQYACPDKKFHILSKKLICPNMKITTLPDIYNALTGAGGLTLETPPELLSKAYKCIDKMLKLG